MQTNISSIPITMSRQYPRPARVYNIQVKTHKMTTVHNGLPPTMKIRDLKEEIVSALKADVAQDALDVLAMEPVEMDVHTVDDFELCRAIKEKGASTRGFEILQASKTLRDSGVAGWEAIFLQFRDRKTGDLLPITYTLPPMGEHEVVPVMKETDNKGKRKASVELDEAALDF